MPTSSTFAPTYCEAPIMRARLWRISRSGRPRRPSLAPSSITTTAGFTRSASRTIRARSEEHTSELQSLMRNSYAVFCLKKNKIHAARFTQGCDHLRGICESVGELLRRLLTGTSSVRLQRVSTPIAYGVDRGVIYADPLNRLHQSIRLPNVLTQVT